MSQKTKEKFKYERMTQDSDSGSGWGGAFMEYPLHARHRVRLSKSVGAWSLFLLSTMYPKHLEQ